MTTPSSSNEIILEIRRNAEGNLYCEEVESPVRSVTTPVLILLENGV